MVELYDLLVKGGLLVDPVSGLNEEMDVAVADGRVSAVEAKIPEGQASRIIDASGLIVTPGLIDLHMHTALDLIRLCVDAEQACLVKGCTTVVDAGSTGELNFSPFKKFIMETRRTRILALLNIESLGMIEFVDIPQTYSDQKWSELLTAFDEAYAPLFINIDNTVKMIQANRDSIIGIKWAHHGLKGLRMAREAADKADCILMIEKHHVPESLKYVRKGDIVTHLYLPTTNRYGATDFETINPELFDVARKGVLLDVGHGKGSFSWKLAERGMKEGLKPNTISTDLWVGNLHGPVFDMPTTMSKFLHLGMSLEDVVRASTATPANAIGRSDEIGTLKPGAHADIVVFKLREGKFPLADCYGESRIGAQQLAPVHVIKEGKLIC